MTPKPKSFARLAFIALMAALQLVASIGDTHAAKFDEKLKAPEAATNDDLKANIREYFRVYARATAESPAGMVTDKAAHSKWYDTQWILQRAIDTKRDLDDLSEFGIAPQGDGSYSMDVANFPQWTPLNSSLTRLLEPALFEIYATDLKARGFHDRDVEAMRAYVEANQPRRAVFAENVALGESFATKVELQLSRKQKIGMPQLMSYLYQINRNSAEAKRAWAAGLLDSMDSQRRRILESYVIEQNRSTTRLITPDDMDAQSKWLLGIIASGEFRQLMERERKEVLQ